MIKQVELLFSILPQYPIWIKVLMFLWLGFSAILIGLLIFVPRIQETKSDDLSGVQEPTYDYQYQYLLQSYSPIECDRHVIHSQPRLSTLERRVCETFKALREAMKRLAEVRNSLLVGNEFSNSIEGVHIDRVKSYIDSDYSEEAYGPKKEKINELIVSVDTFLEEAAQLTSRDSFQRFESKSEFSLDDIILALGFLDFLVAYDARSKIPPHKYIRFGPFFENMFPPNTYALRAFTDYDAPDQQFSTLVSAFD